MHRSIRFNLHKYILVKYKCRMWKLRWMLWLLNPPDFTQGRFKYFSVCTNNEKIRISNNTFFHSFKQEPQTIKMYLITSSYIPWRNWFLHTQTVHAPLVIIYRLVPFSFSFSVDLYVVDGIIHRINLVYLQFRCRCKTQLLVLLPLWAHGRGLSVYHWCCWQ